MRPSLSTLIGALRALALARGNLPGSRVLTAICPVAADAAGDPDRPGAVPVLPAARMSAGRSGDWCSAIRWSPCPMWCARRWRCCTISIAASRKPPPCSAPAPARVFFEVTLPLIRPGVIAGGVFAFIVSFDQFPVSLFLVVPGRRDAAGRAVQLHPKFDLDGAIAAASMVSILLALSVVLAARTDRTQVLRKAYVRL